MNKNDHIDSRRLAQALQRNELKAIYVFGPRHEQFRFPLQNAMESLQRAPKGKEPHSFLHVLLWD